MWMKKLEVCQILTVAAEVTADKQSCTFIFKDISIMDHHAIEPEHDIQLYLQRDLLNNNDKEAPYNIVKSDVVGRSVI